MEDRGVNKGREVGRMRFRIRVKDVFTGKRPQEVEVERNRPEGSRRILNWEIEFSRSN